MTILPVTDKTPACFGVGCHLHAQCQRYAMVERAPDTLMTIGTCESHGEHPHFLALVRDEVAA